ncbi:MAG: LPS export ABC transporter periplasmic protein LptC [Proteobacteria bacterium]|nr:LPS export ABC transporter periplasmic protein LptC [Pseudomonadota bacterium]
MATLETTTGFRPVMPGSPGSRSRRRNRYYLTPRARAQQPKWYSRFVQMMKFLLPAVAALLIALILVWPYLKTEDILFRISFAALTADQTEDPSMVNPRYLGIDKDNQSFSITADLARNLGQGSMSVELEMPKADITLEDGSWLVVTAENGIYQRLEQTLKLTGSVNLYHDSGYEFRTAEARVDLEKGTAAGTAPIRGQGPFGDLQAEGFRLIDKGRTIIFTGKSKLVLYPGIGKPTK